MQNQYISYGIRGIYRVADYALRWGMSNTTAQRRYKILCFWEVHGLQATLDAFEVSRRTLYNWKQAYKTSGLSGLTPHSTAPKHKRQRLWPPALINEIKRLRKAHPNLGKEKLMPFITQYCQSRNEPAPSVSTIGRLIADAPDKMRSSPIHLSPKGKHKCYRRNRVIRKPKGYKAQSPGECIAMDTIERRLDNLKRYVMTLTDPSSHYAFAAAVPRSSSAWAKQVFESAQRTYPLPFKKALTDNGSEFKGEFDQMLSSLHIPHWHTYPKTPKMNAHCERFNRTIQDEFIDYHEDLLFSDLPAFNERLAEWLVWYNYQRPHHSLGQVPPVTMLIKYQPKCNMWWTHTITCLYKFLPVHSIGHLY